MKIEIKENINQITVTLMNDLKKYDYEKYSEELQNFDFLNNKKIYRISKNVIYEYLNLSKRQIIELKKNKKLDVNVYVKMIFNECDLFIEFLANDIIIDLKKVNIRRGFIFVNGIHIPKEFYTKNATTIEERKNFINLVETFFDFKVDEELLDLAIVTNKFIK